MIKSLLIRMGWGKFKSCPIEKFGARDVAKLRILFVANSLIPTLSLSFLRPLRPLFDSGEVAAELLSESQLRYIFGKNVESPSAAGWLSWRFREFKPDVVVFCRYSGPQVGCIFELARRHKAATVLQLDDDLLHVPPEFGEKKYSFHNDPDRLATIRFLLKKVDLVYFSNQALKERFAGEGVSGASVAAKIFAAGEVLMTPRLTTPVKIGYMGIDHAKDLDSVVPALVNILERNVSVEFELFGPMAMPEALSRFAGRVRSIPAVQGYDAFIDRFASLGWSIGICPLVNSPFNQVKSDLKWVEYTAIGVVVVASAGLLYDAVCSEKCGLLADSVESWERSLQGLIDEPATRIEIVENAQARLRAERSLGLLRAQIMDMLATLRH